MCLLIRFILLHLFQKLDYDKAHNKQCMGSLIIQRCSKRRFKFVIFMGKMKRFGLDFQAQLLKNIFLFFYRRHLQANTRQDITEKAFHRIKHEYINLFKVLIIRKFLLKNAQFNFSSRFPRDVIDSALMNSSNSIDPSC